MPPGNRHRPLPHRPPGRDYPEPVRLLQPLRDTEILRRVLAGLLTPPAWATHSIVEDQGVTHERVSDICPRSVDWPPDPHDHGRTTELSISVVDRHGPSGWFRTEPGIQIEGGTYTLPEARRLQLALDDLLQTHET